MLTQEQVQELDNLVADMQANQAADDDIQAAVDARKAEMLASLEEVKKEAVVEDEIALATAETVDTELQSENGSLASQYDSSVDINQGGITPENENEVFAPTASGYMAVSNNEEQLEENAAENGAVPVAKPSDTKLYNLGLDAFYNTMGIATKLPGKFLIPKIANVIANTADLLTIIPDKVPKLAMNAAADIFLDDEDMDDENERNALRDSIDAMHSNSSLGLLTKGLSAVKEGAQLFRYKKEDPNEDFLSLAENGEYLKAADDLLDTAAGAIPSVLAAMTGIGGILTLGGGAAYDKFEKGFEDLEGKNTKLTNLWWAATEAGAIESVSTAITGGTAFLAKKLIKGVGVPVAKNILGKVVQKATQGGIEFVEEGTSDLLNRVVDKYQLGDEKAMNGWARGFLKNGIVGAVMGIGMSTGSTRQSSNTKDSNTKDSDTKLSDIFNGLNKTKKNVVANFIQPKSITKEQGQVEKEIINGNLELQSLKNKPELYKAKQEEIKNSKQKLSDSRNLVNDQLGQMSDPQLKKLSDIDSELNILEQSVDPLFNTELEVETAKNRIQELKDQQTDVFLNPEFSNIKLAEKAQKLYDEKGVEAVNEIVNTQEGTIRKAAINRLNNSPKHLRYDGDVDALVSELRYGKEGVAKLVETYNPESGVPIAAYIAKQLPLRAKRAVKQVLSQDQTIDMNSSEAANLTTDTNTDFEVEIGSKLLADQLKIPMDIVKQAEKTMPAAMLNIVNKLKNKNISPKKDKH